MPRQFSRRAWSLVLLGVLSGCVSRARYDELKRRYGELEQKSRHQAAIIADQEETLYALERKNAALRKQVGPRRR